MSNVVSLRPGSKETMAEQASQAEESRAVLVRRIQAMIEQKPKMASLGTRRKVANNLWSILAGCEQAHGIKKSEVFRWAFHTSREDSTKRLPRFAINPELPESEQIRRAQQLTAGVDKYLRIADAVEHFCRLDKSQVIIDLFKDTEYFSQGEGFTPEEVSALSRWVNILNSMATWVSRHADLPEYTKILQSGTVGCTPSGAYSDKNVIVVPSGLRDRDHFDNSYVGWIPSVPLYSEIIKSARCEYLENSDNEDAELVDILSDMHHGRKFKKSIEKLSIHRSVNLGLAPLGASSSWVPIFETRIVTLLTVRGEIKVRDYGFMSNSILRRHFISPFVDIWWEVTCYDSDDNDDCGWTDGFLRFLDDVSDWRQDQFIMNGAYFYLEVADFDSCKRHLFKNDADSVFYNYDTGDRPDPFLFSDVVTVASLLEYDLLYKEEGDRFDRRLLADAQKRVKEFKDAWSRLAEDHDERLQRLMEEWKG